jgi:hypothetical protein
VRNAHNIYEWGGKNKKKKKKQKKQKKKKKRAMRPQTGSGRGRLEDGLRRGQLTMVLAMPRSGNSGGGQRFCVGRVLRERVVRVAERAEPQKIIQTVSGGQISNLIGFGLNLIFKESLISCL